MFMSKQDILDATNKREIVFWGCSEDWVPKNKMIFPQVERIVDINWNRISEKWMDLNVTTPEDVLQNRHQFFVVITTGSYESVAELLQLHGWEAGIDYSYSPTYYEFHRALNVSEFSAELVFTSSDYGTVGGYRSSRRGGGVYRLSVVDGTSQELTRVAEGSYRQGEFFQDLYYCIEYVKNQIHIFDNSLNFADSIQLDRRHYTGLSVNNGYAYAVCTAFDCIDVIDIATKKVVHTKSFSTHNQGIDTGIHHLNDCCYHDGFLFFGYFSRSGAWRNEVFDGGIALYDTENDNIIETISGLFQPHSPIIINDQLHFCESPKGFVFASSWNCICSFPGFVRGLDYRNGRYFIGQSETLYMKRAKNISNIMMNTGIYCVDADSLAARFIQIDGLKNIHSVHVLDAT